MLCLPAGIGRAADWPMNIVNRLNLPCRGRRVRTNAPPEPVEVAPLAGISRSAPLSILLTVFWEPEQDEGGPAAVAQALFIEATDTIELLRSLLEPATKGGLEDVKPKGHA
jgi:hypothetical protein